MICPECASPIVADQHFCRDCGRELIARPPNHRLRAGGVAVLGMMFLGLLVAMFGKMFDMRWLAYLGLVILLTGAFVIAVYAFLKDTRPRMRARRPVDELQPAGPASIEKADTTNKLLPIGEQDYIPSVTEKTTNLLETPAKR
jgi:predicted nucleic acid-binding Zn ribbon protein